ncbi:MAG: hypothetical protein IPM59_03810 [Chloracidobacterium sp.]|nr:hypothetical protein [Chloracidobacterium sp.]
MANSPPSINWQRVIGKLTYSAMRWMVNKRGVDRNDPIIRGISPGDLAQEAVVEVIEKYAELSKTGTEEEFLKMAHRIMWHDFLDLVKTKEYRARERLDEQESEREEEFGEAEKQLQELEDADVIKEFYAIAGDDQELKDYIDAVVELGLYKREAIADILGVSAQEVTNRQRRLNYKYLKKEKKRRE